MVQTVAPRGQPTHRKSQQPDDTERGQAIGAGANRAPNKNRLRNWVGGVAAAAVVAAVLAIPVGVLYKGEREAQAQRDKTEQEALANATSTSDVMMFHKGVKYRSTPHMVKDPRFVADNIDGEIDSALVVRKPVEYKDDAGNTWVGFQIHGEPAGSQDIGEVGQRTYWINYSEVDNQQHHSTYDSDQPLVTVHPQPASESPSNISVNLDEQGVMRSSVNGEEVGTGMFMDQATAQFVLDSFDNSHA